jgi:hypothetical protein
MPTEHAPENAFPVTLEHKHGLSEWWPMLPERASETIEPGAAPIERIYRCQKVGCTESVRIGAGDLRNAEGQRISSAEG